MFSSGILGGYSYTRKDIMDMREDQLVFALEEQNRMRNIEVDLLNKILNPKKKK